MTYQTREGAAAALSTTHTIRGSTAATKPAKPRPAASH
eukprot:COSAG06_NODE_16929_length_972_cov_1.619702_2_plen_37_part_01